MQIVTRANVQIARPLEAVFDYAVDPQNGSKFMKKRAPIPGVLGITVDGDGQQKAGARRRVAMSDGSEMGEEVVALERPRRHAYRWLNPPKLPFSLLVRTASAEWTFSAAGGGTAIEWVYTFELTTPLVYPLAAPTLALFRGWMQAALDGIGPAMAG